MLKNKDYNFTTIQFTKIQKQKLCHNKTPHLFARKKHMLKTQKLRPM